MVLWISMLSHQNLIYEANSHTVLTGVASIGPVEHRSQKIAFKIFSAGQNILSNNGKMHHLDSLLSNFSSKSFQMP